MRWAHLGCPVSYLVSCNMTKAQQKQGQGMAASASWPGCKAHIHALTR